MAGFSDGKRMFNREIFAGHLLATSVGSAVNHQCGFAESFDVLKIGSSILRRLRHSQTG